MSFTPFLFLTLCVGYLYTTYFYNIFVPYLYHVLLVDNVTLMELNA